MALVIFAVYGALHQGNQDITSAEIVTTNLQRAIDTTETSREFGVVRIDNENLRVDPAVTDKKHFGAIVQIDRLQRAFACEENQTINFNRGGLAFARDGGGGQMALVIFAVYGALRDGNQDSPEAAIVTHELQQAIDNAPDGVVRIDNENLRGDPASGVKKHFGAIVQIDGEQRAFACQENQTIRFFFL